MGVLKSIARKCLGEGNVRKPAESGMPGLGGLFLFLYLILFRICKSCILQERRRGACLRGAEHAVDGAGEVRGEEGAGRAGLRVPLLRQLRLERASFRIGSLQSRKMHCFNEKCQCRQQSSTKR